MKFKQIFFILSMILIFISKSASLSDKDSEQNVLLAIKDNNYPAVEEFIKKFGVNHVFRDNNHDVSLLYFACKLNKLEIVKKLVEAKGDINIKNMNGITPILASNTIFQGFDVAKYLLSQGIDVNAIYKLKNEETNLMLWTPMNYESIKELLNLSARTDVVIDNKNIMSKAIYLNDNRNTYVIELLLKNGCLILEQDIAEVESYIKMPIAQWLKPDIESTRELIVLHSSLNLPLANIVALYCFGDYTTKFSINNLTNDQLKNQLNSTKNVIEQITKKINSIKKEGDSIKTYNIEMQRQAWCIERIKCIDSKLIKLNEKLVELQARQKEIEQEMAKNIKS